MRLAYKRLFQDLQALNSEQCYTAPEMYRNHVQVDWLKMADVWSLGLIYAFCLTSRSLITFARSSIYQSHLVSILKQFGTQSSELYQNAHWPERGETGLPERVELQEILPEVEDEVALDLIKKMLKVDPQKRITIDEVLKHPFFSK